MASIIKHGKRWRAMIRREGFSRSRVFDRRADAQAWAASIEASLNTGSGLIRPPAAMTLSVLIHAYLKSVPAKRSKQAALLSIAADGIGAVPISKITDVAMREFIDRRLKSGAGGATIAGSLSNLSAALRWARDARQIDLDADVAKRARQALSARRISTRSKQRNRIPTPAELAAIYAVLDNTPRLTMPVSEMAQFAAVSGLRLSEQCALRAEDVNLAERTILIRNRKTPHLAQNDQRVPIFGEALDILARRIAEKPTGRIWQHQPDSVANAWRTACRKANVENLRWHDLRHLALTSLARMGMSAPMLRLVSGHHDLVSLSRYVNLSASDFHAEINRRQKTIDESPH